MLTYTRVASLTFVGQQLFWLPTELTTKDSTVLVLGSAKQKKYFLLRQTFRASIAEYRTDGQQLCLTSLRLV